MKVRAPTTSLSKSVWLLPHARKVSHNHNHHFSIQSRAANKDIKLNSNLYSECNKDQFHRSKQTKDLHVAQNPQQILQQGNPSRSTLFLLPKVLIVIPRKQRSLNNFVKQNSFQKLQQRYGSDSYWLQLWLLPSFPLHTPPNNKIEQSTWHVQNCSNGHF